MVIALIVVAALAVGLIAYFISINNGLVAKKNRCANAWSVIDIQLKRKIELIPNLVETVKGYMKHEEKVLVQVTEARSALVKARGPQEAASADAALTKGLQTLFLVANESYPELKANASFLELFEELRSTENKVAYARQAYTDAVMIYTTALEQFPGSLLAGKFQRYEYFSAPEAAQLALDLKVQF